MTKEVQQDHLDVIRAENDGMITLQDPHGLTAEQLSEFQEAWNEQKDGPSMQSAVAMAASADPAHVYDCWAEKNLTFGEAVAAAKRGLQVARKGWNGKGMFICYQHGYPEGIPINANTAKATGFPIGTVCNFDPYLMMYTAAGTFVPWLASQTDMLASDWEVVKPVLKLQEFQS